MEFFDSWSSFWYHIGCLLAWSIISITSVIYLVKNMGNCFEGPPKPEVKPEDSGKKPENEEPPKEPEEETKPSTEKPEPIEQPEEKPTEEPEVPDEGEKDFAAQLLDIQNEYRKRHGVPPLTIDAGLNKQAQDWADHIARNRTLQHADTDQGENLAMRMPALSAQQAADLWYGEIKDYDFSNPGYKGGTGHFTQMVWKGSKQFGAGIATGSDGASYVVGRYTPAGNVTNPGYFKENVLPAK